MSSLPREPTTVGLARTHKSLKSARNCCASSWALCEIKSVDSLPTAAPKNASVAPILIQGPHRLFTNSAIRKTGYLAACAPLRAILPKIAIGFKARFLACQTHAVDQANIAPPVAWSTGASTKKFLTSGPLFQYFIFCLLRCPTLERCSVPAEKG